MWFKVVKVRSLVRAIHLESDRIVRTGNHTKHLIRTRSNINSLWSPSSSCTSSACLSSFNGTSRSMIRTHKCTNNILHSFYSCRPYPWILSTPFYCLCHLSTYGRPPLTCLFRRVFGFTRLPQTRLSWWLSLGRRRSKKHYFLSHIRPLRETTSSISTFLSSNQSHTNYVLVF